MVSFSLNSCTRFSFSCECSTSVPFPENVRFVCEDFVPLFFQSESSLLNSFLLLPGSWSMIALNSCPASVSGPRSEIFCYRSHLVELAYLHWYVFKNRCHSSSSVYYGSSKYPAPVFQYFSAVVISSHDLLFDTSVHQIFFLSSERPENAYPVCLSKECGVRNDHS